MKRSALIRRRPRRRGPKVPRPGPPLKIAPGWAALCRNVRERDGHHCRRCGGEARRGSQVDHIVPRRLLDPALADAEPNLALLCSHCHPTKTHTVEADLFAGDLHAFFGYIRMLKATGPTPSADTIGAALMRLGELLATGGL